jgi:hypothetical protein
MSQDSLSDMIALNSLIILNSGDKIIAGQFVINIDYLQKAKVMFDSPIATIEIGNSQILNILHRMNKVQIRKYDFSETQMPLINEVETTEYQRGSPPRSLIRSPIRPYSAKTIKTTSNSNFSRNKSSLRPTSAKSTAAFSSCSKSSHYCGIG